MISVGFPWIPFGFPMVSFGFPWISFVLVPHGRCFRLSLRLGASRSMFLSLPLLFDSEEFRDNLSDKQRITPDKAYPG